MNRLGAFLFLSIFTSFIFCTTSNSLGLPGSPYAFKEGLTAKQIVFSVLLLSATTKLVVIGLSPRSLHSTEA